MLVCTGSLGIPDGGDGLGPDGKGAVTRQNMANAVVGLTSPKQRWLLLGPMRSLPRCPVCCPSLKDGFTRAFKPEALYPFGHPETPG